MSWKLCKGKAPNKNLVNTNYAIKCNDENKDAFDLIYNLSYDEA